MKLFSDVFHKVVQVGGLVLLWLFMDRLARLSGVPLPAGVLGLVIVASLLLSGILKPGLIEEGAGWLLAEMPLFFIPPLLSLSKYGAVFSQYGLKLLAVIVIGTLLVMTGTGLVVDHVFRFEARMRQKNDAETA